MPSLRTLHRPLRALELVLTHIVFSFNRDPKELARKDFPFGGDEDASSGGERASGRSPPEIAGQDCSKNQIKLGDFLWVAVKRDVGKDKASSLSFLSLIQLPSLRKLRRRQAGSLSHD